MLGSPVHIQTYAKSSKQYLKFFPSVSKIFPLSYVYKVNFCLIIVISQSENDMVSLEVFQGFYSTTSLSC